ncbi:acyltransferase family protein [Pelosinus sp. sgz500959]|uniref:acyltransferase family protein n=1 Tax=Pelosinus sp. sgz500959 TaxID=3242472 RepID=UPI00366EDCC8
MLLVLLHHCGYGGGNYILAFHMPLFFVISGYLYSINQSVSKRNFSDFSKGRFVRLIVPYFAFEMVNLILSYAVIPLKHNHIDLAKAIVSILTCLNTVDYPGVSLRLWFLPCMFVSNIFFYGINKLIDETGKYQEVLGICVSIILFILSWLHSMVSFERLPFTLDISIMATAFICLGYFGARLIKWMISEKNIIVKLVVMVSGVAITGICTKLNSIPFYMYIDQYGNYLLAITGAIAGVIAALCGLNFLYRILYRSTGLKSFFLWLGNNSLAIFPIHLEILYFAGKALQVIGISNWSIKLGVVIALLVPTVNYVTMYIPFLLGMNKQYRLVPKEFE